VLGWFWSLLNPLLMLLLFYLVFGFLLGSDITHFHLFLMVALLPWNYFIGSVSEGMGSIIGNGNLVKKVYFPREILPISTMLANLVNFMLSLPVLFAIIVITGAPIRPTIMLLPVLVVIQSMFILGLVLFLSSLAVFYRDTTHIMGIILQLWFFVTPIFYPLENIASPLYAKLVRWLNPMASLVDFYRDILYGGMAKLPDLPTPGLPSLDGVARTALTALLVLGIGAYVFHHYSGRFGEEL
jgi:lipopolysaccharide transport system permease protein